MLVLLILVLVVVLQSAVRHAGGAAAGGHGHRDGGTGTGTSSFGRTASLSGIVQVAHSDLEAPIQAHHDNFNLKSSTLELEVEIAFST